ncbi:MAG: hypothetical protein ABSA77_07950 [Thermoguttaceae bacterium]
MLVAYEIYRGPGNQYGKIAGVFGRSEFGAEITLAIAYQVYIVGLSFDKVCLLMNFFQHLKLRKSQANALLNQLAEQLFTFVTVEPVKKPNGETMLVSGTNNEAERTLRSPAQARGTGRTNKTVAGARRQTVIVSVLESLRQHLSTFTLSSVIKEIRRWCETGRSCFAFLRDLLFRRGKIKSQP